MTRRPRPLLVSGLGVALATCIVTIVAATATTPAPESSPLRPPGWGGDILILAVVLALAFYSAALYLLRRSTGSVRIVVLVAFFVQLAALFGPVLLSRDVYAYWAYGRIGAVHEGNPYADVPANFPGDPGTERMGSTWLETPSLYGPVFTGVSELVSSVTGESPRAAELTFRALAALCVLIIVLLAGVLAPRSAFGVALVGWNPLLALHFAGGGHNDAMMMALVLGALALDRRGHAVLGGLCWASAIGVKWVAVAFLGLFLVTQRFRQGRLLLGVSLGLVTIGLVATARYGLAWIDAASGLAGQARRTGSIGLAHWLKDVGLSHQATLAVLATATVAVVAYLMSQAWLGYARLGLAGVLLAVVQGWLNPWYALWGLSLAAVEDDPVAQVLAVLLSAFLLRDALPL